jgi:hypothetical protein
VVEAVERAIDRAWHAALSRPGVRLFDGPLCRFEGHSISPNGDLTIDLSQTSYRVVVGTNFANPDFADTYGVGVMANPVGVSTGLLTSDGWILMGRRNGSVAYYPNRVHPFAGSLEVEDQIDIFDNVRRELSEELSLESKDIARIVCLGIAEDTNLRHPETIHMAWTNRTRPEIEQTVHADEHNGVWCVRAEPDAIEAAISSDTTLTPIARAVLKAYAEQLPV